MLDSERTFKIKVRFVGSNTLSAVTYYVMVKILKKKNKKKSWQYFPFTLFLTRTSKISLRLNVLIF